MSKDSKNLLNEQAVVGLGRKGSGPKPAMEGNKKKIPETQNLLKNQSVVGVDKKLV